MPQVRESLDLALQDRLARRGGTIAFGQPVDDEEWDLVQTQGHVAGIATGQATIDQIAEYIWDMRRTYRGGHALSPRSTPSRTPRRAGVSAHQQARAEVFVADALTDRTDRCGLQRFRREVLADRLVEDVAAWIHREVTRQGPPTVSGGAVSLLAVRVGDDIVRRATSHGGRLDRLRVVSESLAAFYGWESCDAATLVLAGITPPVRPIRAQMQLKFPMIARSRIVLTIDPTCTPQEVAATYGRVRAQQFRRVRRLNAKHARLAVFAYQHRDLDLPTQFATWNRRVGARHRYPFLSLFQRDAEMAVASLTELRPQRAARRRT